jgi:hypothetical protein
MAGTCQPSPDAITVDRAHELMQEHLRCPTGRCPQRQAALAVLVESGRYVLAVT